MTKRCIQMLAAVGTLLTSLAGAVSAAERVTLPVREGDNVSMMLAMSGVSQSFLMELISSAEIATRLEAVRAGNTLELELDDGTFIALWLYDHPDGLAFRAIRRSDGTWRPQNTKLSEPDLIASKVRQREALGLKARADHAREEGETRLSETVISAELALNGKVNALRQPLSTRAATQRKPARQTQPTLPTSTAQPTSTTSLAKTPPKVRVAPPAKIASARNRGSAAESDPTFNAIATVPAPATTPTPAPNLAKAHSKALSNEVTTSAAPASKISRSEGPSSEASTNDAPARIKPVRRKDTLASIVQSEAVAAGSRSANIDSPASSIPLSCPGIEGAWRASYTNFDCEAKVSFAAVRPGVYKMAQDGCGDIDGTVAQEGRNLSGKWEHAICDGVLTLTLDASCGTGTGTWQANAGKALCSVKRYPVTITRDLKTGAKPRKRLKLFSGPSKEAAAVENEAAGDP